ncbi:MAG: hypothetical protein QXJ02_04500 [Candidatus Bathyarchaeia archaeon]
MQHVLARKDRFDSAVLRDLEKKNPYQNVSEVLEIEERLGVKSTFFFRTFVKYSQHPPPPYDLSEYRRDIKCMVSGGWEVALHADKISCEALGLLKKEKAELEKVAGVKVYGNRVHYTLGNALDTALFRNLRLLGFKYDSSVKHDREKFSEDFGYFVKDECIVFPITLMDALIFHYNVRSELEVLKTVKRAVNMCRSLKGTKKILTIDWHDCSLKMKYGRKYGEVLAYLVSQKDIAIKRGIELANMIEKGEM